LKTKSDTKIPAYRLIRHFSMTHAQSPMREPVTKKPRDYFLRDSLTGITWQPTFVPASARATAIAAPRPLREPVTSAFFLFN